MLVFLHSFSRRKLAARATASFPSETEMNSRVMPLLLSWRGSLISWMQRVSLMNNASYWHSPHKFKSQTNVIFVGHTWKRKQKSAIIRHAIEEITVLMQRSICNSKERKTTLNWSMYTELFMFNKLSLISLKRRAVHMESRVCYSIKDPR